MISVHHLNNSRSQRVLWLLEELALPYEIIKYERDPKTLLAPPALRAIHPLGKSPVITDGAATLAESAAILEYLVETYAKPADPTAPRDPTALFVPVPGTPAYRLCRYFMHYAEGSLMPLLLMKLVFNRVKTGAPFVIRPIAKAIAGKVGSGFLDPGLAAHLAFLIDHLGKHAWFAGEDFTIADIQMSFSIEAALVRVEGAKSPKLTDWLARIKARPAYRRAIERGGEYSIEV